MTCFLHKDLSFLSSLSVSIQKQDAKLNLQPPPEFDQPSSSSRNDSLSSDTKFDIILASLQNLAHELEKDFEQDEEVVKYDTIKEA